MGYLFKGQDRRDIKKSVLSLKRTLSRDVLARGLKKTTAISTRAVIFDDPGPPPNPQTAAVQTVLAILQVQLASVAKAPAYFTLPLSGSVIQNTATVVSGGNYPSLKDGDYPLTIIDMGEGYGAVAQCHVASGVVTSITVTAGGTLYTDPKAYLKGTETAI
jgi:hypothetical protein